ncbi:hypothetical protein Hanom_Chr10g00881351 [Helianthus anomalus]
MLLLHQRSIFFYSSPSSQSNRYLEVRFLLIYFDLFGVKSLQACVPHIRYILISPRKFNKVSFHHQSSTNLPDQLLSTLLNPN